MSNSKRNYSKSAWSKFNYLLGSCPYNQHNSIEFYASHKVLFCLCYFEHARTKRKLYAPIRISPIPMALLIAYLMLMFMLWKIRVPASDLEAIILMRIPHEFYSFSAVFLATAEIFSVYFYFTSSHRKFQIYFSQILLSSFSML